MKRNVFCVCVLGLVLLAAGCRGGAPVVNLTDRSVPAVRPVAFEEVTKTIISAGAGLGWDMKAVSPGLIKGTLHLRDHTAMVDINYTATNYSITYSDSVNLKYDAAANTIHPNYNGWVQRLDQTIRSRLAAL